MADFVGFRTFQKIRYFLADAFPFLARIGPGDASVAASLQRFPRIAGAWERLRHSALGTTLQRVASTFVIGHLGGERLDWSKIPRDAYAVLRATIVLAASLCLLVPLAMTWIWPVLGAEAISGRAGAGVAGWSIALWFVAVSLGWSTLLAGTGAANRVAFVAALALFLYFGAAIVAALPKSWWSLLLPAQASLAILHSESRVSASRAREKLRACVGAIISGGMTAALLIVVIPTAPWFRGRLILVALAAGAPLGIALGMLARRLALRAAPARALRLDVVVATLAAMYTALLVSLAVRGGLTAPAGSLHALAIQVTGFLWPLYFFIGAGVVFKVLRQTTTVYRVTEVALPKRLFVALGLAILIGATAIAWVKPILLLPAFPWPGWLVVGAEWLYEASSWVWHSALLRRTVDPMKWVLLGAVLLAAVALLRRRLTSAAMARVLFAVILAAFVVSEYFFQAFGFIRTPRSTAFSLGIFTVFVLWLVHRTAAPHLTRTSSWWPAGARIALYGSVLMFVLFPIHARAALHDGRVTNEIFLYLFHGSLNFGLPYYLYLYASRRFKQLPLTVTAAVRWILSGAAIAVALTLGDKIALARWSLAGAWAQATAQTHALAEGRQLTISGWLPTGWVVARGILLMAALAGVGAFAQRRSRSPREKHAATVVAVIGVASGVLCFANRGLELPLFPQSFIQLIAPLRASALIDVTLVLRHLSILLPALMLGVSFTDDRSRVRRIAWYGGALLVHVGIGVIWPAQEPWLRSTGALFAVIGIALIALCALAVDLRDRLDRATQESTAGEAGPVDSPRPLTWPELRAVTALCLVVLLALAGRAVFAGRSRTFAIAGTPIALQLPVHWAPAVADSTRGKLRLTRSSWSGTSSELSAELTRRMADATDGELLNAAVTTADIEPLSFERWEEYAPGALALDFRVKTVATDTAAAFGTAAVARLPNGDALLITVMYAAMDAARRWDVARAIRALPR